MDVSSFRRSAILPLPFVLLLATAFWSEAQSTTEYSLSLAEAKRRGTFITEVEMVPSVLKWKGHRISLKDGWIEKCEGGGCYLCFHLKEGREAFYGKDDAMLVLEDRRVGVKIHFGDGWTQ